VVRVALPPQEQQGRKVTIMWIVGTIFLVGCLTVLGWLGPLFGSSSGGKK